MIWGPFLLALALGIIVSAGLYFAYLWPQVEPDDDAVDAASAGTASAAAATGKSDSTDAAATRDRSDSTAETDEATVSSSESSPA